MTIDLDAYLKRIGHDRVTPSVAALESLHAAHVATIPFENVDVILHQHPGIALDAVEAKLVHRQRGGYCYEHASLFAAALEQLGFTVHRRMARVQPHKNGPRTHMMFSSKLIVMRLEEGLSRRLVGDKLTLEYADGRTESRQVTDVPEARGSLGLELTAAEVAALKS